MLRILIGNVIIGIILVNLGYTVYTKAGFQVSNLIIASGAGTLWYLLCTIIQDNKKQ